MEDLMHCPICDTCVTSSCIIPFELLSQNSSALSSEFLEQLLSATKTNENRAINKIVVSGMGNFPKNIFSFIKKKLKVDLEQMMNGYDVKGQLGAFFFGMMQKNGHKFRFKTLSHTERSVLYDLQHFLIVRYNCKEQQETYLVSAYISSDLIIWLDPKKDYRDKIPESCKAQYKPLEMRLTYSQVNFEEIQSTKEKEIYERTLNKWMKETFGTKLGSMIAKLKKSTPPKTDPKFLQQTLRYR